MVKIKISPDRTKILVLSDNKPESDIDFSDVVGCHFDKHKECTNVIMKNNTIIVFKGFWEKDLITLWKCIQYWLRNLVGNDRYKHTTGEEMELIDYINKKWNTQAEEKEEVSRPAQQDQEGEESEESKAKDQSDQCPHFGPLPPTRVKSNNDLPVHSVGHIDVESASENTNNPTPPVANVQMQGSQMLKPISSLNHSSYEPSPIKSDEGIAHKIQRYNMQYDNKSVKLPVAQNQ